MTTNERAVIGGNHPPSPIDDALAPYADAIELAQNTLTGAKVENETQMRAVDDLLKQIKAAKKAVEAAEESVAKPLYDAWKGAKAEFKPTIDDLDKQAKGLVAMGAAFKKKLADEKAEAERAARAEAERIRQEAVAAAAKVDVTDIDAVREVEALRRDSEQAQKYARAASSDRVRGMRTVTRYEVIDERAALHDIARNDKTAMAEFIAEYVRKNHKLRPIDGVAVWQDREAF